MLPAYFQSCLIDYIYYYPTYQRMTQKQTWTIAWKFWKMIAILNFYTKTYFNCKAKNKSSMWYAYSWHFKSISSAALLTICNSIHLCKGIKHSGPWNGMYNCTKMIKNERDCEFLHKHCILGSSLFTQFNQFQGK